MPEVDGEWISYEDRDLLCLQMIKHHLKNYDDGLITREEAKNKVWDTVYSGKYFLHTFKV